MAIVNSYQNSILYVGRTSWNCKHIIEDQDKKTFSSVLLSSLTKGSESVENTRNLARLEKNWNEFNFFQARKIYLWNKMSAAIEMIGIGILIKELEEIKLWIWIKLLIEIKYTEIIKVL